MSSRDADGLTELLKLVVIFDKPASAVRYISDQPIKEEEPIATTPNKYVNLT